MQTQQGEALTDVLPYRFLNRKTILEEIQGLGVYSDFHPFTKDIENYPGTYRSCSCD